MLQLWEERKRFRSLQAEQAPSRPRALHRLFSLDGRRPRGFWPLGSHPRPRKGATPVGRAASGVTEPDGHSRLAPLGKVDRGHHRPEPFRARPRACLHPGLREVRSEEAIGRRSWTSCQRSNLLGLSRASVAGLGAARQIVPGQGRAVGRVTRRDPPYKPRGFYPWVP